MTAWTEVVVWQSTGITLTLAGMVFLMGAIAFLCYIWLVRKDMEPKRKQTFTLAIGIVLLALFATNSLCSACGIGNLVCNCDGQTWSRGEYCASDPGYQD
jgi:hypothetical protein